MNHDLEQEIKHYLKEHLKESRYQHSLRTADCAKELAEFWHASAGKAYLTGLCHDIAKGLNQKEALIFISSRGLSLDKDTLANPDLWHAPIGAVMAKELFGIKDEEILSAIKTHTVGAPGMTRLGEIIFLADLIEPGRDFAGVTELRQLSRQDLSQTMAKALKMNIDFVMVKGANVHPLAKKAYDYYRMKQ